MARIGLVLGAGGVTGGAFHAGVISALFEQVGWDARRADWVLGTSAGSLAGAMLRAGLPPLDFAARALGDPLSAEGQRVLGAVGEGAQPPDFRVDWRDAKLPPETAGAWVRAALRPWGVRPGALLATGLPEGQTSTEPIRQWMGPLFGDAWPKEPLHIAAVRMRDARRVVFGRDRVPGATVAHAVAASCAIPGVFAPVAIGSERYVDGGAHSPTNADLARREKLDLLIVSSPMSAAGRRLGRGLDEPFRRVLRWTLAGELARVRAAGTRVVALQPTGEDRRVMGWNAMDPRRRRAVVQQIRESTLARLKDLSARGALEALKER